MNRIYGVYEKDLRNRSSKHLILLQGWKPAVRSISGKDLEARIANGDAEALKEQRRRQKRKNPRPPSKKA